MLAVLVFVLASELRADPAADAGADETLRYSTVRFQSLVAERDVLRPWEGTGQQAMFVGSGFLLRWDEEGPLVCTNAHVINDASAVVMQVPSIAEQQFAVKVVLVNHDMDIALVRLIDAETVDQFGAAISKEQFLPVQLYDGPATLGMSVHAMGFPLGVDSLKLTTGAISGSQVIGGFLSYQTNAPISPGNSGGPLFIAGTNKVVGINYASLEAEGAQQNNFVVPGWRVQQMMTALDADSQAEPVFGQYQKAACAESREMCTLKIPPLAAEILPATKAMYEHYGCDKGVFASKVHKHSLLHTADPPIPSKTFITKINNVDVDSYGQGMDGMYTHTPVDFLDLAFMGDELEATVETCTCGFKQTHKVQLRWQAGNEAPVPYIDEPTFATMDFEQFGDLTMAPLTLNAAKALMQQGAMQLVSFVADSADARPQLLLTDVQSGGEASQSLQPGSIVSKVNGVETRSLADLRANFHPTGTIACKAQEELQMKKVEEQTEGADGSNVLFQVLTSDASNGWTLETTDGSELIEDFRITLVVQAHKIRAGEAPVTKGVQGALMNFAEELKAAEAASQNGSRTTTEEAGSSADEDGTASSDSTTALPGVPASDTDPGLGQTNVDDLKAMAPSKAAAVHAAFAQTTAHLRPIEARVGARRGGAHWSPF